MPGGIATTIFQWMGFTRYNTSAPVNTNGSTCELQSDVNGNLKVAVSTTAPLGTSFTTSGTPGDGALMASGARTLYRLTCVNEGTAKLWLFVFDATTKPSGTPASVCIPLPVFPSSVGELVYPNGRKFNNGIYVALSSTYGVFTDATGGLFTYEAEWL